MKIYTALQIGEYHLNHCEDYLIVEPIGENKNLLAVMDGCSMGIDSHFIATLTGKLLRKIAKERGYKELYDLEPTNHTEEFLKSIVKTLFKELKDTKNQLLLEARELLTTLIILLIDKKKNDGCVLVIGDGLVSINGNRTEFDQDNKPDYLGFHLNKDFETWYSKQTQKIVFNNVQDISIATDGILMFTYINKLPSTDTINPVDFLLLDKSNEESDEMLERKLKQLEHSYYLKPGDDLAIIRVINKN